MQITRSTIDTQKGPADWFTGRDLDVRRRGRPLHARRPDRLAHAPPRQTIFVTEGVGLCQREGGPIEVIRPGDRVFFDWARAHAEGRRGAWSVPTNDQARELNRQARDHLVAAGKVDDLRVLVTAGGERVGAGDLIATRLNEPKAGDRSRRLREEKPL